MFRKTPDSTKVKLASATFKMACDELADRIGSYHKQLQQLRSEHHLFSSSSEHESSDRYPKPISQHDKQCQCINCYRVWQEARKMNKHENTKHGKGCHARSVWQRKSNLQKS